jgi:hypothetical protein
MSRFLRVGLGLLAGLLAVLAAAGSAHEAPRALSLAVGAAKPAELPGLQNVFRVSEKLYSGWALPAPGATRGIGMSPRRVDRRSKENTR